MNIKDNITKKYMKNNAVFADAFNFYVYAGRQIIRPDDLQELDITESAIIYAPDDLKHKRPDTSHQRYRDILKSAVWL